MNASSLQLARYRARTNLRRGRGSYLALALLIAIIGGIAMAATAAARRTQSSFPAYVASTNPSTLVATLSDGNGLSDSEAAAVEQRIDQIPGVSAAHRYEALNAAVVKPDGKIDLSTVGQVDRYGSVDGLLFDQDQLTVLQGRLPDPGSRDEMVATPMAAQLLGLYVGQVVPWEFVTSAQANALLGDETSATPALQLDATVVGLVLFHDALVEDDVDRLPTAVVFPPAVTASLPRDWAVGGPSFTYYGVKVQPGADIEQVEDAINALTPADSGFDFHLTALATAKAERAVMPESIALAVFGLIAGAAALLIALQVISRTVQRADIDRGVLRAIGAAPWATAVEGLLGLVIAIAVGAVLAVVVAIALSPLAPIGPARAVYPHRGIDADWTVLGAGLALLVVLLSAGAVFATVRRSPHRLARLASSSRSSRIVRATAAAGLPPSATIGTRFALEPGRGATAVPVRSAVLGSILTVVMVVATLTFSTSLRSLVSHPSLYGWNWDYVISGNPWVPSQARDMVASDHAVLESTSLNVSHAVVDGQEVPVLLGEPGASPAPPVLSGHGLQADDEIVLGVLTLQQIHAHVGDTVGVVAGGEADVAPKRYHVVGTAVMPAVGQPIASQNHPSMGIGALLPFSALPADVLQAIQTGPDPSLSGPGMTLVRMRPGTSDVDGLADMHRIAAATNASIAGLPNGEGTGDDISVQTVQHPAEIVNYRNLGTTPSVLDAGLAAGALIALGLTLTSSVRRRRRDLALLRAFGSSGAQLRTTIAWQASVVAIIGSVVGIPLGIAAGRWLWTTFARSIYVVPHPTTEIGPIILVAIAALVLANIVAAAPGRVAAHTPAAQLLRSE